ncbi:hypothetical protein JAAARDRAFT_142913 [Jaapia argillacea MUCL 33604]|uniref:Uncharacterized protein n=1 Tax=Jaapia argillacea MUCL 33604 TaxID=933084 RepID=A0A067PH41_9AGAM|nr:hypothetical protein JAAARDRAFT_142913 [Jaapia argillacea MUCL 33604]
MVKRHSRVYVSSRQAMVSLGANQDILDRFQVLTKDQMKAEPFVIDPGMHGQRYTRLAWFWSLDVNKVDDPYMIEFTRVHWLRAKCKWDQWAEEATILSHEMGWMISWFKHQFTLWHQRMEESGSLENKGKRCYAAKQAAMWLKMLQNAEVGLEHVRKDFPVINDWN